MFFLWGYKNKTNPTDSPMVFTYKTSLGDEQQQVNQWANTFTGYTDSMKQDLDDELPRKGQKEKKERRAKKKRKKEKEHRKMNVLLQMQTFSIPED